MKIKYLYWIIISSIIVIFISFFSVFIKQTFFQNSVSTKEIYESNNQKIEKKESDDDFSISDIDKNLLERIINKSYQPNMNIDILSQLKYLKIKHVDFEGVEQQGELIVNQVIAQDILDIFKQLYEQRYPIHSVRLIDDFNANDELSMQANNTSAFAMRYIGATKLVSKHSYGLAIDINPLFNPMVTSQQIYPANATNYVDRSQTFKGKIDKQDLAYQLFIQKGFTWGGDWNGQRDYQHFEK